MRNYHLLVGPSGCGKSTWLKQITEKLPLAENEAASFYVASRDEVVHEVAKENELSYTEMFLVPTEFVPEKTVLIGENGQRVFELQHKLQTEVDSRFAKRLFEKLKDETVTDIYVDMTNLSRKTRKGHVKRFLGLEAMPTWNVVAHFFLSEEQTKSENRDALVETLVKRCSTRTTQPVSKEVIEMQLQRYVIPSVELEPYLNEVNKAEVL